MRKVSGRNHHDLRRFFVSRRLGGLRMSFMTILLGCTKQHTHYVYAVAVVRIQAEQNGGLTPSISRCLSGVVRKGSHLHLSSQHYEPSTTSTEAARVIRVFRPHRMFAHPTYATVISVSPVLIIADIARNQ